VTDVDISITRVGKAKRSYTVKSNDYEFFESYILMRCQQMVQTLNVGVNDVR